jgi:hypothetical protein
LKGKFARKWLVSSAKTDGASSLIVGFIGSIDASVHAHEKICSVCGLSGLLLVIEDG